MLNHHEFEIEDIINKHKSILDNIKEGFSIYEDLSKDKRKLIYCNIQYVEMSGYTYEELINISDTSAVQIEYKDAEKREENIQKNLRGEIYSGIFSWIRPDGKENYIEYTAIPRFVNERKIVIGIDYDITGKIKAEKKSKITVSLLTSILESIADGVIATDNNGNVVLCNRQLARMWAITDDEFNSPNESELLKKVLDQLKNPSNFMEVAYKAQADPNTETFDTLELKNGKIYERYSIPQLIDEKIVGRVWSYRDVTELKISEKLAKTQIKLGIDLLTKTTFKEALPLCLDAIIDVSGMDCGGIYLIDEKIGDMSLACQRKLSDKFIELVSYYEADSNRMKLILLGKPMYINSEFHIENTISKEGIKATACIPISYDGNIVACINIVSHELDSFSEYSKRSIETISTQIGSTIGRIKAQEALQESEEKYRILIENANDGITVSQNGIIKFVNPKIEEISGYSKDELIGKYVIDFVHPEDREQVIEDHYQRLNEGKVDNPIIGKIITKDGRIRWVEKSGVLINWEDSPAILSFVNDVTEKRKMEEEIFKIQKLESVGTLAGGIAHDFNNILTGILGNISLARMFLDQKDKASARLAEAEKAAYRAKDLTSQLLTFSKGGDPILKIASISDIISEATSFALSGSKSAYNINFPDDLWTVFVDEGQINQVINNLIINADQAMPQGGIIDISLKNVVIDKDSSLPLEAGHYVKIDISDQGIGIPEEHLPKIFDPYFTTKQKGSGLGLAITYSIIRKHNAHIAVDSKLGLGTTFTIYIPASSKQMDKKEENQENIDKGIGKILIMDDTEIIRELLSEMLMQAGYEVVLTSDGSEAIETYIDAMNSGKPFDVTIIDLTVPGGMGGIDTIIALREFDPNIRAIVSSGYSNNPIMSNFREYGFDAVIVKPYKPNELYKLLQEVIEK